MSESSTIKRPAKISIPEFTYEDYLSEVPMYKKRCVESTLKKHITFSPDTKTHDGLNPINTIYDNLIMYTVTSGAFESCDNVSKFICKYGQLDDYLDSVMEKVADLKMRLNNSNRKICILPTAGGSNAKLLKTALPNIEHLYLRLETLKTMSKTCVLSLCI
jgi:hypothetical protein